MAISGHAEVAILAILLKMAIMAWLNMAIHGSLSMESVAPCKSHIQEHVKTQRTTGDNYAVNLW